MIEFANALKRKYKIGIITDNKAERVDVICKMHEWQDVFAPIIVSQTVGSTKRDSRIFEIAAQEAGIEPNQCIFIDNSMKNVETSSRFGMHGVYFDDEVRDYEELKKKIEAISISVRSPIFRSNLTL